MVTAIFQSVDGSSWFVSKGTISSCGRRVIASMVLQLAVSGRAVIIARPSMEVLLIGGSVGPE
jgi:hypothetical protein